MKTYRYPFRTRFFRPIYKLGMLMVLGVFIWVVVERLIQFRFSIDDFWGLFFLLVFLFVWLCFGYAQSDIRITDEHLILEGVWRPLVLDWDAIGAVETVKQVNITGWLPRIWFVRTRRNLPYFVVFGLWYRFKVQPGFLIYGNIENAYELVHEITQRARRRPRRLN